MQITEQLGCGKFAVAARAFRAGDLVHVSRAFTCLPTVGRLRSGTVCLGCCGRISPAQRQSALTATAPAPSCPMCGAKFCSPACLERCARAHRGSGECAVVHTMMVMQRSNTDLDFELMMCAAIIARGVAEGATFPLETPTAAVIASKSNGKNNNNHTHSNKDLLGPFADCTTCEPELDREIKTCMTAPRVSLSALFPELLKASPDVPLEAATTTQESSSAAPSTGRNNDNDEEDDEKQLVETKRHALAQELSVPPLTSTDCYDTIHSINTGVAASNTATTAATTTTAASTVPQALVRDKQIRMTAILQAPAPSFFDFCNLVSNAGVMRAEQIERVLQLHSRYKGLARKVIAAANATSFNNNQTNNARFFVPTISPAVFLHTWSQFAHNNFGITDPRTDNSIASSVNVDASYFNHSCQPNLYHRTGEGGRCEVFHAQRDIQQGESLCIDYGATGDKLDAHSRRVYLLENYRFWCGCEKCVSDDKKAAAAAEDEATSKSNSVNEKPPVSTNATEASSEPSVVVSTAAAVCDNIVAASSTSTATAASLQAMRCRKCVAAGQMRQIYDYEAATHPVLVGHECRFCFGFVPVVA